MVATMLTTMSLVVSAGGSAHSQLGLVCRRDIDKDVLRVQRDLGVCESVGLQASTHAAS
jgi:hypothetical protein